MWTMPQIAMMEVLKKGIEELKSNPDKLEDIFGYMRLDGVSNTYGDQYINQVKDWFINTKIPVLQAWSLSQQRIPCISVHLSSESEDESKAAIDDYLGDTPDNTQGVAVFSVNIDVGLYASKTGDQVLWLYYIASYILFKYKKQLEALGLHLQSYSSSEWDRRNDYNMENVWTRWIKFRCTTWNSWNISDKVEYDELEVGVDVENVDGDTLVDM